MHVLVDGLGQVVVDDVLDVVDVETARGHRRRHDDLALGGAEVAERLLALALQPIAVYGRGRVALLGEEEGQHVGLFLVLY